MKLLRKKDGKEKDTKKDKKDKKESTKEKTTSSASLTGSQSPSHTIASSPEVAKKESFLIEPKTKEEESLKQPELLKSAKESPKVVPLKQEPVVKVEGQKEEEDDIPEAVQEEFEYIKEVVEESFTKFQKKLEELYKRFDSLDGKVDSLENKLKQQQYENSQKWKEREKKEEREEEEREEMKTEKEERKAQEKSEREEQIQALKREQELSNNQVEEIQKRKWLSEDDVKALMAEEIVKLNQEFELKLQQKLEEFTKKPTPMQKTPSLASIQKPNSDSAKSELKEVESELPKERSIDHEEFILKETGDDNEEQDIGSWEDSLSEDLKEFVLKHNLSKRTVWNLDPKEQLTVADVTALMEIIKKVPPEKNIRKISMNFSSSEVRIRLAKEFAQVLCEKQTLQELVLYDIRRQSGWTLLNGLNEGRSTITSVTLADLDLPDAWTGPQSTKAINSSSWKELIIHNTKKNTSGFRREDVNALYDSITAGLSSNSSIKRITLRNIPGCHLGDISKFLDAIRRNKNIKVLNLSLEDVWDRIKLKTLADYLGENTFLEDLIICGVDRLAFDVHDFVQAVKSSKNLKRLVIYPIEVPSPEGGRIIVKGVLIDDYLHTKLQRLVNEQGTLKIYGKTDHDPPNLLCIAPE